MRRGIVSSYDQVWENGVIDGFSGDKAAFKMSDRRERDESQTIRGFPKVGTAIIYEVRSGSVEVEWWDFETAESRPVCEAECCHGEIIFAKAELRDPSRCPDCRHWHSTA